MNSPAPAEAATPAGVVARPGRAHPTRRGKAGGPTPYDFRRPHKLSREHVRALQIAYETFARRWATLLTTSLRTVCSVQLGSIEQITYDEYVASLNTPTLLGLLSLDPVPGTGVLEMSLPSTMAIIDHLLGGPGGPNQPVRPLTDLETELIRSVLEPLLGELRYAFDALVPIHPALGVLEHNPQFAQAAGASDMVVVASFDTRIGKLESTASLCLPYAGIAPHLQSATGQGPLGARERAARETFARALHDSLLDVPLGVSVRFHSASLTPTAVLNLAVGDVLTLPHRTREPLAITAGGMTFGHAVPGSNGRRLAALVVDPPVQETP